MKHIKIFEAFNKHYIYDDAQWWLEYMEPEEIFYLTIYSKNEELSNTYNDKPALFKVNDYSVPKEPINFDSGDSGSFSLEYEILVGDKEMYVSIDEINFSGYSEPFIPATYYDPPEGGEEILESIEVQGLNCYDEDNSFPIEKGTDTVTFKEIEDLVIDLVAMYIGAEPGRSFSTTKPEFSQKLKDKIERVKKENKTKIWFYNR